MTTIHLTQTTTATTEQFVDGLTDFGPGRSKLFPNSTDEYLEVHARGPYHADVTEGGGGTWERLSYDWSDPTRVVITTTDSNVWGGRSGHTYTFTPQPDGTTVVDDRGHHVDHRIQDEEDRGARRDGAGPAGREGDCPGDRDGATDEEELDVPGEISDLARGWLVCVPSSQRFVVVTPV